MRLHYSPGACSLGPHLVLEESGLVFEPVRTATAEGAHRTAAYLAINPRGLVPALALEDGAVVTEVPAIVMLIADLAPEAALLPPRDRPTARAQALSWLCWLSSTVLPTFAAIRRPERYLAPDDDTAPLGRFARAKLERLYAEIEGLMVQPWALGERWSAVDACLRNYWLWGTRIDIDMSARFPRWAAQTAALDARPATMRVMAREGLPIS